MTLAHLDGNVLTHYLINFWNFALSFTSSSSTFFPLKIRSSGGNETNDTPFLHDVSGPVLVIGNPDCHNSAKPGCNAPWELINEKVVRRGSQGQRWGSWSDGRSVCLISSQELVSEGDGKLGFHTSPNNDDADATPALNKPLLHTCVIPSVFTTTLQGRLREDKWPAPDRTAGKWQKWDSTP